MSANPGLPSQPRRLYKDVLLVAKGTVLGQAPFVIASPFITRLYSPRELGIYGLALAFVGIAAPAVGLRFELAAISARNPEDSRNLLWLSALAIIPLTVVTASVLATLKLTGVGSYNALSWVLVAATVITIATSGAYSTLRSWFVRRYQFGLVANSLALQGTIRAAVPLVLAPFALGALALIGGELIARCIPVSLMASRAALFSGARRLRASTASIRMTAKNFWKYPVLLAPSALVDATAVALPVPIVATCYNLGVAGKFALVQRLVVLPAALIVSSVGDVFHAHAAEAARARPEVIRPFIASTALRLLAFALAVYIPIAVVAPFAAAWVFGRDWADAGPITSVLVPVCIAQTVVSPLSRALLLNNSEERKLIADLVCLILPTSTLYLATGLPVVFAIACFSVASVVAFAIYFVVIVTSLGRRSEP